MTLRRPEDPAESAMREWEMTMRERIAGLPDASMTLSGAWGDADMPFPPSRTFPRASRAPFMLRAPDGCVILTGLAERPTVDAAEGIGFNVRVTYCGRTPDGRHWHTLGWWARLRWRLRRLARR